MIGILWQTVLFAVADGAGIMCDRFELGTVKLTVHY